MAVVCRTASWGNVLAPKKDKMADAVCNGQTVESSEERMEMEHPNVRTEATTARLMITKIVNENFKSYAGTQELGPFHKVQYKFCGPVRVRIL